MYAVAVVAGVLIIMPIADYRLGVQPNLILVLRVLMAAADLLTAYLLVQLYLASGRLSTLCLSSAYLYSCLMTVPFVVAFTRLQHSGASSTWSEVCLPWLFLVTIYGFPVLVAAQKWVVAALPARLSMQTPTRRPAAAAAVAAAAVLALVIGATGLVFGGADWLPRFSQDGAQTAAGRWMVYAA
ncbi:hypothetical protein ACWKSP_41880, partial [Micromonosporaceae bacterium Da 78-11]